MSPSLQTILALGLVASATVWLITSALRKRRQPGCGDSCGAVNPEIRELQSKLKKNSR